MAQNGQGTSVALLLDRLRHFQEYFEPAIRKGTVIPFRRLNAAFKCDYWFIEAYKKVHVEDYQRIALEQVGLLCVAGHLPVLGYNGVVPCMHYRAFDRLGALYTGTCLGFEHFDAHLIE